MNSQEFASQSSIFMAALKDNIYAAHLSSLLKQILENIFSYRYIVKFEGWINISSYLLYSITSRRIVGCLYNYLRNKNHENQFRFQSLGEEYVHIYLHDHSTNKGVSLAKIILFICVNCVIKAFLSKIIKKIKIRFEKLYYDLSQRKGTKLSLLKIIFIRLWKLWRRNNKFGLLKKFDLGLFLIHNQFPNILHRLFELSYFKILKDQSFKNKETLNIIQFKPYGQAIVISTLLAACFLIYEICKQIKYSISEWKTYNSKTQKIESVKSPSLSLGSLKESSNLGREGLECSLCFTMMKEASSTPCGHLFCWNCIQKAIRGKEECPLCRKTVYPQQIIFIKNPSF